MKTFEAFREHFEQFLPELEPDAEILKADSSPLADSFEVHGLTVGNRWTIHPMEGWDAQADGNPSELTLTRWRHFGESGAKLIWGGEAVAVREDGRANPNQLIAADHTMSGLEKLRSTLLDTHAERFGSTDDLLLGLQLTHSGRFCRPFRKDEAVPRIAYRHPVLDARVGASDASLLSDEEIAELIENFVVAAKRAHELGYQFVDVKHCHGYLLHELLGAHTRDGRYGGSFENRTRFLREVVAGIRSEAPGLLIGVRVSAFDVLPFRPDPAETEGRVLGPGIPEGTSERPFRYGFAIDQNDPTQSDLTEAHAFLNLLRELDIRLVNISGGSPYYNPHLQRPALYPPSDGYRPPEDPTLGVARHLRVTRELKKACPDLVVIGSALSYLQDYLPHVSQALVREGWMDSVGLGRMVLSYWDLPADTLEKGAMTRKKICRTFSDCTTAPRKGIVSGCYPLDPFYGAMSEAEQLREIKRKG